MNKDNKDLANTFLEDMFQTVVNLREEIYNLDFYYDKNSMLYSDQDVWDVLNKHTSKMKYIIRLLERVLNDED